MKLWLYDTVERAIFTAAETFLAVWIITDSSTLATAGTAAAAAALAVVKAAIARRVPSEISPASVA